MLGYSDWSGRYGQLVRHHMVPGDETSIVEITDDEHRAYHRLAVPAEDERWQDRVAGMLARAGLNAVNDGVDVLVEGAQVAFVEEDRNLHFLRGYKVLETNEEEATSEAMEWLSASQWAHLVPE